VTKSELEKRTKAFALAVIRFIDNLPKNKAANLLGMQLLRSATSIRANYQEANRAEGRRDFGHKVALSEKEAVESLYWIELFDAATLGNAEDRRMLFDECNQLVAIFTRIGRTTNLNAAAKSEIRHPTSDIS
jgi:four helix bundle protein